MTLRTVIRGGSITGATGEVKGDLLVEGEKIVQVGPGIEGGQVDREIDASGMLVLSGVVDAHTHIQLDTGLYRTADNWEIGTSAAAAGGVTTVIDFANQLPGRSLADALMARRAEAALALIDYTFHMVILQPPDDPAELEAALGSLLDQGITSLKLFTTYRPNYYLDDAALLHIFRHMPAGMVAMIHCENDSIVTDATRRLVGSGLTGWQYHPRSRPAEAEIEAVGRVISLAELSGSSGRLYIAHCSTADTVAQIERLGAAERVFCETCPQYLLLDDSRYESDSPELYILQPPLRSARARDNLRVAVREGKVDVLSTDSCDYTLSQKRAVQDFTQTPGGLPGVETLLPLMYTLLCHDMGESPACLARLVSENPARIFGLFPQKGIIAPGSDADIVLYDPRNWRTIRSEAMHYQAGYSPYEGMPVKGHVHLTMSRGEVIYRDWQVVGQPGRGRFVESRLPPAGEHL